MPAFILLVIIGLVVLWFLCSFLYKPIGRFVGTIINDARETMKDEDLQNSNKGDTKE